MQLRDFSTWLKAGRQIWECLEKPAEIIRNALQIGLLKGYWPDMSRIDGSLRVVIICRRIGCRHYSINVVPQ
ncbi:hypothetical protein CKO31_02315 [Thiohalocapsa halophila]|uniref:Uncharacterized protein n=1 Tax=Thiohalocapsa halophila TaxID=69359 RepID=A0ABS1CDP7_9GAMM|nr:hypothetical protein [Thiohalocapsa halophila]